MPKLSKAGYYPAGVSVIVDRRQRAPEKVRTNFNTYYWTGDSASTDEKGGTLLTMYSQLLRQLIPESPLVNGALELQQGQWEELKANRENSLYLMPEEVEALRGKGYVLKEGIFVPANKAVAKAWDFLNRESDLQSYAQLVSEASCNNDNIMRLYFDRSRPSTPSLRSLLLGSIASDSLVTGNRLCHEGGRMVGISRK